MLRLLGLALVMGCASGASVRQNAGTQFLAASTQEDYMPAAAIKRVIGMLENLIAEMDAEQAKDEEMFAEFSKWCEEQQEVTQQSIDSLNAQIEELSAALAKLYAQKAELEAIIAKLKEDIATTRSQIAQATQKRNEEHAAFIAEQQDFDNSIKACAKAIEILAAHYGDGTEEKAERPDWMGFTQVSSTITRFAQKRGMMLQPEMMEMLQTQQGEGQQGPFDRYGAKTGEALNIVDQMKELSDTFAADKQSAIDEENHLQKMYETLMKEKTELLNSLIKERDERQAVLNAVNQEIGEKETAKANAEAELEDEQKYLASVKKSCDDTAILFEQRKKDRAEEKLATQEAIKVLGGSAGEALIQLGEKHQIHRGGRRNHRHMQRGRMHMRMRNPCPQCRRAAALLSEAAQDLRSGTLATAAAATMGTDAVADVIQALNGLIDRLDADQKMETAHKEWCEAELAATQAKKEHHEATVEDLVQKIADEKETIVEKKQAIQDTIDSIARADHNFEVATQIRADEKAKFEEELQNYKDALDALNQAIDILSKFYASKGKFLQEGVAPRAIAPGVFDSAYQMKGGAGVIEMIATVRKEYEQGKADLEAAEAQAVIDFAQMKAEYQQARRDLVSQQDRLETELHTAEMNLSQFEEDKKANEDEIANAKVYLGQLGQSCDSLLKNYDKRVELRKEEKGAIKKAIDVLENETL